MALSVTISGAALVVLSTLLFQGIKNTQQASFDSALHNHAVDVANATNLNMLGGLIVRRDVLADDEKIFPFPLGQSFVQIRTLDRSVILSSKALGDARLPLTQEVVNQLLAGGTTFETVQIGRDTYRLVDYLINRPSIPPLVLQIAVPLTLVENERRQILLLFWTWIPLVLAASALAGLVTARKALEPMNRIIKSARSIQPHELSTRVPVPRETELNELATTLNDLLSRLQKAFESQEKFIADASHQLKTPLAIIRGEIDVFRTPGKQESTVEKAQALLTSVSQEINQLTKMVDDLLLLARFDGGGFKPTFENVRIDEVLIEAIGRLSKLASEQGVEIAFDIATPDASPADFEIAGDFDLLQALFFNLIENSIKYTAKPGRTAVRLFVEKSEIRVEIEDRGQGIAPEDLHRIFDRFHRGEKSQHVVPGVGLGLSIAQRIARFHGADLDVQSALGQGTTFLFRIQRN